LDLLTAHESGEGSAGLRPGQSANSLIQRAGSETGAPVHGGAGSGQVTTGVAPVLVQRARHRLGDSEWRERFIQPLPDAGCLQALGIQEVLVKPVGWTTLAEVVQRVLAG